MLCVNSTDYRKNQSQIGYLKHKNATPFNTYPPKGYTYSNKRGFKLQVCLSMHNPQADIM